MSNLGDIVKNDGWTPESIDLTAIDGIIKEARTMHDTQDIETAASLTTRLLTMADHLSDDIAKMNIYFTTARTKAKDLFNELANAAITEKSDAARSRVAESNTDFRKLRDEYKKAELLVGYLQLKYKELFALHYDFRDRTRRLSGLSTASNSGSG